MKLILIDSVEHLGLPGDLVDVKTGYARNFLLPQGKALKATESNVEEMEHQKRIAESRRRKIIDDLQVRRETLNGAVVEFVERVTEAGKLYGSVTKKGIAEALSEKFGNIPVSWIRDADHLKEVGEHAVVLHMAPDVEATISVVISADQESLAAAADGASEEAVDEATDDEESTTDSADVEPEAGADSAVPVETESNDDTSTDE